MNLRYLDQVKEQTQIFMQAKIAQNYFTGEAQIPLTATLQEAEVLFAASDNVKALGESGELGRLHERVQSL